MYIYYLDNTNLPEYKSVFDLNSGNRICVSKLDYSLFEAENTEAE